ncbi:zinc finger CCCH domain-containing protein 44-like isoform X2 [Salvia miltiorrhiza]|uniref:zinc finger CCCH domain-containing protein 44-like isoform X2 n=1 Tax=Salvia miltiorrhiza TaxID=226208 RepID=UPI0025AB6791|nr:zinc finger CCCH domain-containing protein 44-like isoform X2 [Salvia miltiorrhiza]
MENIETLLAAVAQTQGFDDDDDEPVASTPSVENSASAPVTQLVAADVRPSPAVGQVIGAGEKRKRGRPPKAQLAVNPPPPKRIKVEDEEEDVCFICFDGGSLVLCDRKGCPKAYHPACIKRDEAFFQSKAKWNCGWHICSVCRKASYFTCYTCTYSLCKSCIKKEDFLCVRGNKGFCSTCIKPIMLIENKDQATNDSIKVDFDDKLSWEYLFKMYWLLLKEKLSLTLSEITQAKNPWKIVATEACKPQFNNVLPAAVGGEVSESNRSTEHLELNKPHVDANFVQNDGLRTSSNGNHVGKRHGDKEEMRSSCNNDTLKPNTDIVTDQTRTDKDTSDPVVEKDLDNSSTVKDTDMSCITKNTNTRESDKPASDSEWASKDLLEFVAHMKNGDTSAILQFDVQTLLLEYIKRNNLRDPRRKSQIICDQRLKSLFGKPRVGHIEMLKLLEFHFLIKEDSHKNSFIPAGFVSSMANDVESDGKMFGLAMPVNSRKRKTRKKSEDRAPHHDLNEYAAIDVYNISLIYLRRNLMENLLDDRENFNNNVVGSIVRIRISTNDQKPEVNRLVQVVGTSKVAEPYKIGNRTADVMLEVSNLDKKEVVSIDGISNQEFTEEECRRLRQSIRCGLVKHFTIGEVQKKAVVLQSVRVKDWLEAEVLKLNHLRDRASEKGHKKELRECVDKLQLLKSPEERKRRISEVPEIHADPKMNPDYESEEDNRSGGDGKKDEYVRPSYFRFPRNAQKTSSSKEERSTEAKNKIIEKTDASGSSSGRNDQAMQRSGLETSTATAFTGSSPSADNIETEKLWHYRDPNGKIQGPFSMMQLRKWSTTGLFPPDMRIWTNHEQYDSLLLTDALSGKLHAASDLSHALSSGSCGNKPPEGIGVREGTDGTSKDSNKQAEATGVMKVDEAGSSGWPQCWDLLKDSSSSVNDVKPRNLPPPSSSGTRHAALTDRCQGGDDPNRGSQTGEKTSVGLTQSPIMTSGHEHQSRSNNEDRARKPYEENSRSLIIDLSSNNIESGSVSAPVLEPPDSSKQAEDVDILFLPSPTPKVENQSFVSADVPQQNSGVLELLSPTPKSNNENEGAQATQTKPDGFVNLLVSNSGPGWNASVQLPEVDDEWCGYSPTPARPSVQEWDPGLVSASPSKPPEVKIEIIDTSPPDSSTHHPMSNMPNWLAIMNEPIEFVALGEDSVSDLLAEVDAMESQGTLPSPTSAIKFARELLEDCKDDCFSSIEEFSSSTEPRRSDAVSSTSDVHLSSRSSEPSKLNGTSPVDAFDFFRRSSVNSSASSEGETNAPVHSSDTGSEFHPPSLTYANQEITGATMAPGTVSDGSDPGWGTLQGNMGNINLVTVQGNVNLVLGGPGQGMANLGWGTNAGPTWANPSTNRSPRNGSLPWDGQRKYGSERFSSPREWGGYQGGEAGFGRGRPPWGRQPYGGGGGGYSRPPPKGQRVCKFYEGGHCKKGAFCDYLHP